MRYLNFSHNTDVNDKGFDPYQGQSCGVFPWGVIRNETIQNNLILNSIGFQSCWGEGTRTETKAFDITSLTFNNDFIGDRSVASCAPLSGTSCYTEKGGPNDGAVPPVTVYLTPGSKCLTNDPVVENCAGVLGAMSTSTFPLALADWHNYRLCKSTDVACNNKASLYAAGGINDATDGTDLGANLSNIDAAQVSNQYCASCGSFPDH